MRAPSSALAVPNLCLYLQLGDVLRARNNKTSHIKADDVKDGTLEEIILDMKKRPFRADQNGGGPGTGEHMRKSFRRQRSERNSMLLQYVTSESEAL